MAKTTHVRVEKTNAARLLDRAKVVYDLVPYEVDEEHLTAAQVADQLGEEVGSVFKTLILKGDRTGYFVCVLPGDHDVDLKAAARVSGNKKADLIPMKDLLAVTGYIRGGCSPVGMKKQFPTYIHSSAADRPFIYISAGVRGLQIKIDPVALIDFVGATVADVGYAE
ncbi:Cys-tRNA(Pro) deacylase [uncultured Alistipes sp.]|jgi:ybaK/ebsC protein|uniref:Cys-tRNA(Pro) deacylase n=1 Tax=uncultured Alistipes sp. TaxID=538949 RepID=UPI0025F727BB|nr:Cys-tRNA(Pro) deacylase [uncultured Alistipes sp.]